MSALTLLVVFIVAAVAACLRALVTGVWAGRALAADFVFALAILVLPGLVHP